MSKQTVSIFLVLASFLLFACSEGVGSGCGTRYVDCSPEELSDYEPADASGVDAESVEAPEFDGCLEDCSGHEAGFEWARDNDVTDESECSGNSDSFIEGCEAFAYERQEQSEEEAYEDYEEADYERY